MRTLLLLVLFVRRALHVTLVQFFLRVPDPTVIHLADLLQDGLVLIALQVVTAQFDGGFLDSLDYFGEFFLVDILLVDAGRLVEFVFFVFFLELE